MSTMTDELLQIGDFAKRANTNLRTLRYYEELGLITPARRSQGKFRYYALDQLERVRSIKRLQNLGLSLREIQDIMVPSKSSVGEVLEHMESALDKQITLVAARLKDLQQEHRELQRAREKLAECRDCNQKLTRENCDPCMMNHKPLLAIMRSLI